MARDLIQSQDVSHIESVLRKKFTSDADLDAFAKTTGYKPAGKKGESLHRRMAQTLASQTPIKSI
jgi:hypothetical protein